MRFAPRPLGIFIRLVRERSIALRYGIAVLATALSLGVSLFGRPATYQTPYLPFFGAVLVSVLFGGLGPGLLATAMSAIVVHYYVLSPYDSFQLTLRSAFQGAYFCLTFGAICWLIARRDARSETEIASREKDLRRAQAVASTGSWRLDVQRNQLLWSDETYCIFDIPVHTLLTYETFLASVHPDDRGMVDAQWRAALEGDPYDIEHRIMAGDSVKWVRETAELDFDEAGRLRGGFGAVQDITKRKHAEQALRESESRLQTVLQILPVGVWLTNSEGEIVFGNPAAQRIWAGARYVGVQDYGEYKGWWYATGKRIAPEDWALARALKGETSLNELVEIECFDGTHKIIYNSGIPIRDEDGRILGALVINEDITDQKKAEEALMRTEKLASAGRFAATVAHEVNNPLEAVTNILYLARSHPSIDADLRQLLDIADQEVNRVTHITRTTLGFYRDSAAPAEIKVDSLVKELLALYQRKLDSKQIVVECRLSHGAIVHGNAGEIRQVLSNLIANAIDAVPNGGRIVFAASPAPNWKQHAMTVVTVADNGAGILRKDLRRIFEAFYTTKENVGNGLGLWISKSIVERHGGSIRLRSRVGKGTVFQIHLPAKPKALTVSASGTASQ